MVTAVWSRYQQYLAMLLHSVRTSVQFRLPTVLLRYLSISMQPLFYILSYHNNSNNKAKIKNLRRKKNKSEKKKTKKC